MATRVSALQSLRSANQLLPATLRIFSEGFTRHTKNRPLRAALRAGRITPFEWHEQLVQTLFRLIFLFLAEDRKVDGQSLLHPKDDSDAARIARNRYAAQYSTDRLRSLAARIPGSRHGDLWRRFQHVVSALSGEQRLAGTRERLALPILGSYLWDTANTSALIDAELTNFDFLEGIRHLAFIPSGEKRRRVDYRSYAGEELGRVYECLLSLTPQMGADGGCVTFTEFAGSERKSSGSYYTPDSLVQCLLDSALEPAIEEALDSKRGTEAEKAVLSLRVCDPAVGSGCFLVGAAHRIARHLARVRALAAGEQEPSTCQRERAIRDVIGHCLYGVDVNPMAAELCRVSLWLEAMSPGMPLTFLDHHIKCGDSLLGATPGCLDRGIPDEAFDRTGGSDKTACRQWKGKVRFERAADARARREPDQPAEKVAKSVRLARPHRFFDWHLEFPEIFGRRTSPPDQGSGASSSEELTPTPLGNGKSSRSSTTGFDVILGNPPFVNAIESGVDSATKAYLRVLFPRLGGTADLSFYFVEKSAQLVHARGRIGLILPRVILNARPADELRRSFSGPIRPNRIYAPNRADFFPGAAVFICALVLGPDELCLVSHDDDPNRASWRPGRIRDANWWLAAARILNGVGPESALGPKISDLFDVSASMTTGDAYDIVAQVVDKQHGSALKLVTTGLIDPGTCHWGNRSCRYLKRDFQFPRVRDSKRLSKSLRKRLRKARRPKVLVAGLSRRIECFLDREGESIGAVSTYSIYHPADDVKSLEQLAAHLLSPWANDRFQAELGGNAMGGGNTTMKKHFLQSLALRADRAV